MTTNPTDLIRSRLQDAEHAHSQAIQQVSFYNGVLACLRELLEALEGTPAETTPEEADALAAFANSNEGEIDGIQQ